MAKKENEKRRDLGKDLLMMTTTRTRMKNRTRKKETKRERTKRIRKRSPKEIHQKATTMMTTRTIPSIQTTVTRS